MTISLKHYGPFKPGPGVNPLSVERNPKLPFNQKTPLNWFTGKHLALTKPQAGVSPGRDGRDGTNGLTENQVIALLENYLKAHEFDEDGTLGQTISNIVQKNEALGSLFRYDMTNIGGEQFLVWNGENWVAIKFRLRELFDVQIKGAGMTPEDGDILQFDEDKKAWVAGQPESGGGPAENPTTSDTLGAASEGSEGALSDTWLAGGTNGLQEWYVSRMVYNHAGDMKLYKFMRKRTYDRYGRLYSVSGEVRVEIENPVAES
jgi:hypothetical protein